MIKLRMKRQGRKKRPFYRVVVTDARNRRDGAPIMELGYYDPIQKQVKLDKAEAKAWLAKGAQASRAVLYLISVANDAGEVVQLAKKALPEFHQPAPKVKEAPVVEAAVETPAAEEAAETTEAAAEEPVAEAAAE